MVAQANNNSLRRAVVTGGNRISFVHSNKGHVNESSQNILIAAIDGPVAHFGIGGERLDAVSVSAVLKHSRGFNLTRECVLGSTPASDTLAFDIQMARATDMRVLSPVSNVIKLSQTDSAIAGGVDTTSDAPIAVNSRLRRILLEVSCQKFTLDMARAFLEAHPSDLIPDTPLTSEPRTDLSTSEHQAITTAKWGVTRAEQDELVVASHQNMANAYDEGFFTDFVTPCKDVSRDTNMCPDSAPEKLAKLKLVFGRGLEAEPTMTAGNPTPLIDGAPAVLVFTPEWTAKCDLLVFTDIIDSGATTADFAHGGEGLLMAPVHVIPRLLVHNGRTFDSFDFFEIHEAFAGTALSTMEVWEDEEFCRTELGLEGPLGSIPREKFSVRGSSLTVGHPLAATGGRIVVALAKMLHQKTNETGGTIRSLISVCVTGGWGVIAAFEACA